LKTKETGLILVFCLFVWLACSGQKQANVWYFGNFLGLDFNYSPALILKDGQIHNCFTIDSESASVLSDESGQLLFYTDGVSVWNRNHEVMPNGTDLWGSCTTTQTLIVPRPGYKNICYIFTASPNGDYKDETEFPFEEKGLHYSVVDLSLDNGLGDVVEKNILLDRSTTEKIAGTFHANGRDIWVVMHEWNNNTFNAYLVTDNGLQLSPVISQVGIVHEGGKAADNVNYAYNAIGQMKISPNGETIALVLSDKRLADILNFNPSDGKITEVTNFSGFSEESLYGIEFSPSSRFLYVGDFDKGIYQFDLFSDNIYNSKIVLGDDFIVHDQPGQLQLAPDGKIYVAKFDMYFIGAIHFPDKAGVECKYEQRAIELPVDGKGYCKQGLPNFISTYLYNSELYPPDPIFEMPNVFTPNGDDYNPNFVPMRMYNIRDIDMKIVNRWGQLVYETRDLERGWDGGNSSAGVYYWRADYEGVNSRNYFQNR